MNKYPKLTKLERHPKESNAEKQFDAGCEIKWCKTATIKSLSSAGYFRVNKSQMPVDRVPNIGYAAIYSSK